MPSAGKIIDDFGGEHEVTLKYYNLYSHFPIRHSTKSVRVPRTWTVGKIYNVHVGVPANSASWGSGVRGSIDLPTSVVRPPSASDNSHTISRRVMPPPTLMLDLPYKIAHEMQRCCFAVGVKSLRMRRLWRMKSFGFFGVA